jgi:hypothetical protein
MGSTTGAIALTQGVMPRAEAATWRLHDDTGGVGLERLYSGSYNNPGCDTAESADCRGPGPMSCYWGGLYVNSVQLHRLRTGPYRGVCRGGWPGTGITDRVRWASHASASTWEPEYRFVGQIYVRSISARPDPWTGLVLHPVHIDNCNNYFVRLWERDNPRRVVWGREVADSETSVTGGSWTLPVAPQLGRWYEYQVRVLPGSRIQFYWDGGLVFDATDPQRTYSRGPVGMRLDYFDATLDETRVYRP